MDKDVLYYIHGISNIDCTVAVDFRGSQWVGFWSSGENVGHQINHVSDIYITAVVKITAKVATAEILPEPRLQYVAADARRSCGCLSDCRTKNQCAQRLCAPSGSKYLPIDLLTGAGRSSDVGRLRYLEDRWINWRW